MIETPSEECDPEFAPSMLRTEVYRDATRTLIAYNDSPDIGFDASINPYRGCEHGCIYCYARPTHEYLGMSLGTDFESKIFAKEHAADLLRKELAALSWKPQVIAISGVTDAYQPVERTLKLTRGCLEVLADCRNPAVIITKNFLVTRDLDLLQQLAAHQAVRVVVSITTLASTLARQMEPRASTPALRLKTVEVLAKAGIPVGVNMAPIVPGITDHEIPDLLRAAADAGAQFANFTMLRLPYAVKDLFADWLERHFPERKTKVLHRIAEMRGGRLNDSTFGQRMRGEGIFADQIRDLFQMTKRRLHLDANGKMHELSTAAFRRPAPAGQRRLFE